MLYVNGYSISLDRREPGAGIDFISHAHSDHIAAAKNGKSIIASTQTVDLVRYIHEKKIAHYDFSKHGWIKLLNAGHMLGSKQILLDDYDSGKRTIYSGDYQMQRSIASEAIEIEQADNLIIDSTYPTPEVIFDEREVVEHGIQKWTTAMLAHGIVLFGAYAMGKAQELIAILNRCGITPVVSKKINAVNEIYASHGIALGYASAYKEGTEHEEMLKENFVGVVENSSMNSLALMLTKVYGKQVFTAIATGFAKEFKFSTDAQFPLSDHADFWQAVDYIDAVAPRNVYTYGKSAPEFALNLRKLGYNAEPFKTSSEQAALYNYNQNKLSDK